MEEQLSVSVVVKSVEEDKNVAVVSIFPQPGSAIEVLYVVKCEGWSMIKALLIPGETVEVSLLNIKGNLAIFKIKGQETCSKG